MKKNQLSSLFKGFIKRVLYVFVFLAMTYSVNAQLSEGFEGDFTPPDWITFQNGTGTNIWSRSSTNENSGTYCAKATYESVSSGFNEQWLVTPKLSPTAGDNTFTFYVCDDYSSDYGSVLKIYVSTNSQNNPADFTEVASYAETDVTNDSPTQKTVDLSAYNGNNIYVAFVEIDDNGDNWYIDDVAGPAVFIPADDAGITSIDAPPVQFLTGTENVKATIKNFGSANLTSATIKWAVDAGTGYVAQTDYSWTGNLATDATDATVTIGSYDFSAGGTYHIKVYSDLPNGNADENNANDTTILEVEAVAPVAVPYTQNFQDAFPPYGWLIENEGTGNDWEQNTSGYSGKCMKYPYHGTEAATAWAYSTFINLEAGKHYKIEFYQKVSSALYPEKLKLTVGQGQNVAAQTTTLWDDNNLTSTDWELRAASYVCTSTGTYNFAFNCYSDADMAALYVDEVNIFEQPEFEVNVEQVTENVKIPANTSFNYLVKINNTGYSNDTCNLSVQGIEPGWTYEIRDKADAGVITNLAVLTDDNDTCVVKVTPPAGLTEAQIDSINFIAVSQGNVAMADTIEIITEAYPPYTEIAADFEADMPDYWSTSVNSTGSAYIDIQNSSTYAHSGTKSARFYNHSDANAELYLVTPALKGSVASNKVKFWARGQNDTLFVGTVTDLENFSDFTHIDTAIVTTTYQQFAYNYSTAPDDAYYIAFRPKYTSTYKYYNVDDVQIYERVNNDMVINRITADATVESDSTFTYQIEIENLGTAADVFNLSVENSTWTYVIRDKADANTITNLPVAGESVDTCLVKVTLPSPAGVFNGDIDTIKFLAVSQTAPTVKDSVNIATTAKTPINVFPWLEVFDSYLPTDWTESQGTIAEPTTLSGTSSDWRHDEFCNTGSGDNSARLYFYSTMEEWLFTPQIYLGDGSTNYQLVFDLALTDHGDVISRPFDSDDTLAVVISTDAGATWNRTNVLQQWDETTPISNTGDRVYIDLTGYTGTIMIGFYGESSASGEYTDLFIDNVKICERLPLNVDVNKLTEDATVVAADSAYYQVQIENAGTTTDTYDLSVSGGSWTYEICSKVDSSVITNISVNTESVDTCLVKVILPEVGSVSGGDIDIIKFLAVSQTNGAVKDSINISTTADAPICSFPWVEPFDPEYDPDNSSWTEDAGLLGEPTVLGGTGFSSWVDDGFANVGTDGCAKLNIYGTLRKDWAFTPQILLGDGTTDYQLVFDLALTVYNGTDPATLGDDDKFAVVISTDGGTTWNASQTLQLWDNTTPISNTGERVSIDLSGYTGTVQIGFYGESTVNNKDNDLFVDNVEIHERVAPAATTLTPADGEHGVALDATVSALFNKDIIEVDFSNVTISGQLTPTTVITGGNTVEITPAAAFDNGTIYTVTIPAGAVKDADNITNEAVVWSFTSLLSAPVAETLTPLADATGIALDADVNVLFNQDISIIGTPTITIVGATEGNVGGISASVDVDGKTLLISHNAFANFEEVYTVTIPANSVQNTDGIGNTEISWSFTTMVAGQPVAVSLIPDNNETSVAVSAPVSILFSEDLNVLDLSGITIKDASSVDVTNVVATFSSPRTINIAHDNFVNGEVYTVNIPAGAVENASTGTDNADVSWSFTTLMSAPVADVLVPANNETKVALNATVSITFNQLITDNDIAGITISGESAGPVSGVSAVIEADNKTVTISHNDFVNDDVYTVTVPANAVLNSDLVGNELITWSFTSVMTAPEAVTYVPANSATGILPDAAVSIEFDQDITDMNLSNIEIRDASWTLITGVSATIDTDNKTVLIAHDNLTNYGTVYTVVVPANTVQNADLVGNAATQWQFTITNAYQVNFHVEDAEGLSIQGATVALTGYGSYNTNLSGNTAFTDVIPATDIPFTVDMTGYEQATGNVTVVDVDVDVPDVVMTLTTYTVTFTVDDGTDAIEGATVTLTGYTDQTTNASGLATFTEVAPETDIVYTVNATGYNEVVDSIDVVDADVNVPAISMNPFTYNVTFRIDDGDFNTIEGATVTLSGYTAQTTDASGVATFTGVAPETDIAYTVNATGYSEEIGTVTVVDANVIVPTISLTLVTYTVTFTVDDGTDAIDGATVTLTGYTDQTTNASGIATFTDVVPETDIAYSVNATGFELATGTVSVVDADVNKPVTLLPVASAYSVTFIVGDSVNVINGAVVTLTGYGEQITDSTGTAVFDSVAIEDDIAYTVTATDYREETGTVSVVNAPVQVNVTMRTVGIDELFSNGLNIYPNPSTGIFFIKSDEVLNNTQLFIRDITGRLILTQKLNSDENRVDISGSHAGIYFIQMITDNNKIINYKILLK